ncbi:LLM class flavin-dependent oxidoreductase [Rhodococcus globerulus]|uniref:LLM class flavin-dependent oxidoreductase n=1 Tax=Rhodococcus globerulus TaxID=33008 RepID=UPI001C562A51|nr:LLM class flavin-dependent oxidoreductase [Rhodococcus globerulus]QXW01361.1 LLM class flavin-dependent oxidoreductase [Rhodococcus globerulus]
MRLGVLDYSPIDENLTASEALASSTRLAQEAERLGFSRFWVSEHHGIEALASVSPEVIMSHIAAHTKTIRIGSGGVMLPHYSSMKVAENYRSLEALNPGRIDLGFGRASGADRLVTAALNDEKTGVLPYPSKVEDLVGFLTGRHAEASGYTGLTASPAAPTVPVPWVLAASGSTAALAGMYGLGFTFAHFINPSGRGAAAAKQYRESFVPSTFLAQPSVIVAVFVAVGDTEQDAVELADAFHLWLAHAESPTPFDRIPSIATTREHRWTNSELTTRERNAGRLISGTPTRVVEQLRQLADAYGTDEVMINPMVPDERNRTAVLARLARELETDQPTKEAA